MTTTTSATEELPSAAATVSTAIASASVGAGRDVECQPRLRDLEPLDRDDQRPLIAAGAHVWHPRKAAVARCGGSRRSVCGTGGWASGIASSLSSRATASADHDLGLARRRTASRQTGGVILAANHVSYVDPMTLGLYVLERRPVPKFLAKSSLFETSADQADLHRRQPDPGLSRHRGRRRMRCRAAVEAVNDGECLLIYPEGTATRDPDCWPMKARTGVARLALDDRRAGHPGRAVGSAEPVALQGEAAPHRSPRKRVQILAGEPVDLSAYLGKPIDAELLHEVTDLDHGARSPTCWSSSAVAQPPAVTYDPQARPHDPRRRPRRRLVGDRVRAGPGRRRHRHVLWARRAEMAARDQRRARESRLPAAASRCRRRLRATSDPAEALDGADLVVLAVPSQTLRANLEPNRRPASRATRRSSA